MLYNTRDIVTNYSSANRYMERGEFTKAYSSVRRLRYLECQAARDMYYAFKLLEIEQAQREGRNLLKEFFTVRRNRRAAQSSWFVMFMQQFCGGESQKLLALAV